jgi:hypothetical protein
MANIVKYGITPFIGGQNNIRVRRFYCDGTNNSTAIFVGDVVKGDAGGGVVASTAGAALSNVGVVVGIFDVSGIPVGHPSAAVSTKYLTASVKGYVDVALALPDAFFISQSATVAYALTDVFALVNLVATAGDTTTAHSNHRLGATSGSDFRLLGVVDNPNNAIAAVNCDMIIMFQSSIFGLGTGVGI